ncbi:PREDICTED: 21 kDa protein-like [Tarenaya hassleriana]|uniref:21 kDa protein-like n=1 Tax=Tarenaya hassleriana TaxID=28532 RepID=UPI00053C7DB0|nr:PREDICTED: 21 kDa protein-like [Tarenaya hassleriana]
MNPLIRITVLFSLLLVELHPSLASRHNDAYVRDACSVTRYQELCIRSLSPFSAAAKNSPSKWARAGVSVTIAETKRVLKRIAETQRSAAVGKRDRVALADCRELLQDALDDLHMSLSVLRKLTATEFQQQMSNLATWLSAALTDQDTCLDGYAGTRTSTVRIVRRRVANSMYFTSNALALVNKLATAGL